MSVVKRRREGVARNDPTRYTSCFVDLHESIWGITRERYAITTKRSVRPATKIARGRFMR